MPKIIFEIPADKVPFGVRLEQTAHKKFNVVYGEQTKKGLSYSEAAREFGLCLMHALNCDGKLD